MCGAKELVTFNRMIALSRINMITVKPAFSGHSKIDNKKALKTNVSLTKVESIAEYWTKQRS